MERGRDHVYSAGGLPPLPRREAPSTLEKDKERELQVSRGVLAGHLGRGEGMCDDDIYIRGRFPSFGSGFRQKKKKKA